MKLQYFDTRMHITYRCIKALRLFLLETHNGRCFLSSLNNQCKRVWIMAVFSYILSYHRYVSTRTLGNTMKCRIFMIARTITRVGKNTYSLLTFLLQMVASWTHVGHTPTHEKKFYIDTLTRSLFVASKHLYTGAAVEL